MNHHTVLPLPYPGYPIRRPLPQERHNPVTIGIGFICSDGIVLAADSQHSFVSGPSSKRTDATKISPIEFEDGYALVLQSGATALSKRYVELFQQIAAEQFIDTDRTVPAAMREAMRLLKNEMRAQEGDCSSEQLKEMILKEGIQMECIVAHYCAGKPFIHTINLAYGVPEIPNAHFVSIGSGAVLADYLLDTHLDPSRDEWHGGIVAVHVIETVKKHDTYCSGETRVSSLTRGEEDGKKMIYLSEMKAASVRTYAKALEKFTVERGALMKLAYATAFAENIVRRAKESAPKTKRKSP